MGTGVGRGVKIGCRCMGKDSRRWEEAAASKLVILIFSYILFTALFLLFSVYSFFLIGLLYIQVFFGPFFFFLGGSFDRVILSGFFGYVFFEIGHLKRREGGMTRSGI